MIHFNSRHKIDKLYGRSCWRDELFFTNRDLFQLVSDFQVVDYTNATLNGTRNGKVSTLESCDPPHNDILEQHEIHGVVTSLSKQKRQKRLLPTLYQSRKDVRKIVSETDWESIAPHIENQEEIDSYLEKRFDLEAAIIIKQKVSKTLIQQALDYYASDKSTF